VVLVIVRCPPGARRCNRRDPTRGHPAAVSYPLPAGSACQGGQVPAAVGGNPGAHHLRPAGRHRGGGSVPTGRLGAGWEAASRMATTSSKPVMTCWPWRTSAEELWHQLWSTNPRGALEQGDPPAHRCGGQLPGPSCHHPPHRLAAAASSTEEWAEQRRYMSAEALSKVQPARFPHARHGTEDALPASLAAEDRGRITRWSLHHFSGRDPVENPLAVR